MQVSLMLGTQSLDLRVQEHDEVDLLEIESPTRIANSKLTKLKSLSEEK